MEHASLFLLNLSISLTLALLLGVLAKRLRLSPIIGYLLAGIGLGPYTPGFVADVKMANDFAQVGIILLMFGVGLHFHFGDLLAVRRIAVPGSIGQILVAWALGAAVTFSLGMGTAASLVLGMAVSVASTVVLVRVLSDQDLLETDQGHIAVGWLILQDVFTVFILVLIPAAADIWGPSAAGAGNLLAPIAWTFARIGGLILLVTVVGRRAFPRLLDIVARTRSRELFTLAILGIAFTVAAGSAEFFGVSMALGAFLAGLVVGQTEVSHQAASDALPMRDAFAVLFFVSMGMLFDPHAVREAPLLLLGFLGIILVATPLTTFFIIWLFRYPVRTALTVAASLAQIGEFSFLVANEAMGLGLLTGSEQSLLVTCALITISINPFLFRTLTPLENRLRSKAGIWKILGGRSAASWIPTCPDEPRLCLLADEPGGGPKAVVVGYGPVGRTASRILRDFGFSLVIIDLNLDAIRRLGEAGQAAIYGDASRPDILEAAGIKTADYLLITIPDALTRAATVLAAKDLNPKLRVFARARYLQEKAWLDEIGVAEVSIEEAETAIGLAIRLLQVVGAEPGRIREEIRKIQAELGLRGPDEKPL